MKGILERLKSPVVWGACLTAIYTQLEMWQSETVTAKEIILGCLMVLVTIFASLNNPTDPDHM